MGYISELRALVGTRPLIMAGACVIVLNTEGHILLQKRTDSLDWGTIGGAMELGESFEETAARELYEEAGLTASRYTFIALLSGKDMYYRYPHGDEIYNALAVFEAHGVEGKPVIQDDEGLELAYFPLDRPIPDLNPFSELILRRTGYIQYTDPAEERSSEGTGV
ncbi:ADP-ribose pyrophosphatase [Paenibacillus sambharensis]|uniref:ADP-ribose pyrophosphatase n=1 Tax=Paenibacillus sambharensis TaxID=1803190 RepID=A0A2W1LE14_9BACL|nr:NUDIX hydrolase [Paenibacillus sambharensis]PZD97326.1 ADP-ribose pyrophosphatase [Paenibacillus sambharensis]